MRAAQVDTRGFGDRCRKLGGMRGGQHDHWHASERASVSATWIAGRGMRVEQVAGRRELPADRLGDFAHVARPAEKSARSLAICAVSMVNEPDCFSPSM